MIPQKTVAVLIALMLGLSGCGTDTDATAGARLTGSILKGVVGQRAQKPVVAGPPTTQARLAQFKTPMIMAELPTQGTFTFVVPNGVNGDVETWASADDKTISFRQGIVVATRGYGPDLMQSTGPTIAQVSSGVGRFERVYYYLDGADQTQRRVFDCTLSNLGPDTITVVERQHTTRHIAETCTGDSGRFTNEYWFQNGTFLRKSNQLLNIEWGHFVLSRVIDNG